MRRQTLDIAVPVLGLVLLLASCTSKAKPTKEEGISPAEAVRKLVPAADRLVVEQELKNIALAYQNCLTTGRPPKKIADLAPYYENNAKITKALEQGTYVIAWGIDPSHLPPNTILAYQKEPNAQGQRVVLLCNYQIEIMNAAQFEAAPKARGR